MIEKNQHVLAQAYRKAIAKNKKIVDLAIEPSMDSEAIDALIIYLAHEKAKETGLPWETHVKGQRWYIEDLIKFSSLDVKARLDHEYAQAFPEVASEDELLAALSATMTAA